MKKRTSRSCILALYFIILVITGSSGKHIPAWASNHYNKRLIDLKNQQQLGFDVFSFDQKQQSLKQLYEKKNFEQPIDEYNFLRHAEKLIENFSFLGQIKNETAYRLSTPHKFTKIKNIAQLNLKRNFTSTTSFNIGGRFYYDAIFDLSKNYRHETEKDQEYEAEFRSLYIDISMGDIDFRLGKQQIVWGQAVGLFFADVINPKDLREFILPDLDQIRIPVWAADIEYYAGDNYFEFVWVPVPKFNKMGAFGSEFEVEGQSIPENLNTIYLDKKKPPSNFKNGEFGFRISRLIKSLDLSLFYFYGYDYFPVIFKNNFINSSDLDSTIIFNPEYKRLNMMGMTFSADLYNVIFKGEFILNKGKYFVTSNPMDADGVVRKDYLDYLLGMDYTFFDRVDSNFQLMQRIIFNYDHKINENDVATSFSIWLKTGFMDNALEPEIFFVTSLNEKDLMIRPKISYTYRENWKIACGMDIFEGVSDGNFGRFDKKDRLYLEVNYDF